MLSNCNMSTENYSRTLIGWANYVSSVIPASPGPAKSADIPAGVTLGAAGLSYNSTNYLS